VLWIAGLITAGLTAVYMTRMMWMTFFGESRFHEDLHEVHAYSADDANGDHHDGEEDDDDHHHALPADFKPHESPVSMTVPLIVLAVLATFGGLVGIPYAMSSLFGAGNINVFEKTLEPVIAKVGVPATEAHGVPAADHGTPAAEHGAAAEHVAHSPEEIRNERLLAGLSVLLALSGIGIGIALFGKTPLRKLPQILVDKWRIDELYNGYFVDPLTTLSREGLWKGFDLGFIDGIVNGVGHFATEAGNTLRRVQVGFVRSYSAFILLGALVGISYFIYYGLQLV
jgi:NADH-quinone oxidoreductase subunit L